ncbi:hypothetical protein [Nonomuraea sp. NPDC050202]|uniref:hypothetical protein n=1 Tax=Nonomuraea sp. NPDC050202 TaxID=3155035 RepID=UPI003404F98F
MNQKLKRMLQAIRKPLTACAAVLLPTAVLAITAAPAHAAAPYRVPCGSGNQILIYTKEPNKLCFRGTGGINVAIYKVLNIKNMTDRWVTIYYTKDGGGPAGGMLIRPHSSGGADDVPGTKWNLITVTRIAT